MLGGGSVQRIVEMRGQGQSIRAIATELRRFLKVAFASPRVHGVYLWGFWEGDLWRPLAALYRRTGILERAGFHGFSVAVRCGEVRS